MGIPALILAAGRGERMRPLTDTCPKPLLPVRGQALLAWHVQALTQGGFDRLVFNTAWLADEITSFFGTHRLPGGAFQLPNSLPFHATFSNEQADFGGALETAGGIARALPLLGAHQPAQPGDAFWVVAGDVFVPGFAFSQASVDRFLATTALAHLWLVPNPAHNPRGDFGLGPTGLALNLHAHDTATPRFTYSTIGLYRAALFAAPWCDIPPGNPSGVKAPLAPLLRRAMDAGRVSAELHTGPWTDVGTPERLAELNTL
jgi:N-acetyl-alpha-D-muramate 1-phosphate uridylyltransferase